MKRTSGECCFFTALLGIVILIGCLFIVGVPKFVIARGVGATLWRTCDWMVKFANGMEYLHQCPAAPLIPVYLCVSGLLGVAGVGHSVFLWTCLFRKHMKGNKTTHNVCLLLWVFVMFTIPVVQLVGGPYIIYTYRTGTFRQGRCDVIATMTSSPLLSGQSSTSETLGIAVTQPLTNETGFSYTRSRMKKEYTRK